MSEALILLANDDGYRSRGLATLRSVLSRLGRVVVCAPDTEQSATSHSLSIHRPLRLMEHDRDVFSVDGTPADSVFVAMNAVGRVLPRRPDLVVSGINHGVNLGDDVFYSGTVAAAREGALKGVAALAVSADRDADLDAAAEVATELAGAMLAAAGKRLLLNVNFPAGAVWPVRSTRLGARIYEDTVEFRRDPRGREYLWIGGPSVENREIAGSDTEAFEQGAVSVTPLVLDLWSHADELAAADVVACLGAPGNGPTGEAQPARPEPAGNAPPAPKAPPSG